jgi:protein O-mannosyl-transferase
MLPEDAERPSQSSERTEQLYLWGIIAVTAIVYLRCLGNGFILDDVAMFVHNPDIRHWSFLWKGFTRDEYWYSDAAFLQAYHYRNYRPLFLVWCWINYHLFGLNPAPWHATNLAMYLIVVWLVFKIARRLTEDSTSALLATASFALTPVHVAAVTWVCGSAFVIGTALGLGAFYLILPRANGTAGNWWAAIALYAGALLCHESLTAFPALVACYAFLFAPDDSDAGIWNLESLWMRTRRAVIWMAPFAVELALYLIARRLLLGFFVNNPYYYINLLTDAQAILTIPSVLATYLTTMAMPWRTLPIHSAIPVSSPLAPAFWAPLAAIVIAVAAFLVVEVRDPRNRLHLFCAAWIALTFVPMVMLHSLPHLIQDYYLYLPSVGWCILLGDAIAVVARDRAGARRLVLAGAGAMIVVYAVVLWRIQPFWHDDISIARGYIEGYPESVAWHWNLATKLNQQGDLAAAEREVRTALSLEPDRTGNIFHPHSDELHHSLGELLARRGDIDGAEDEMTRSLTTPPDEDQAHPPRPPRKYDVTGANLYYEALADEKAGRKEQAAAEMTKGLELMREVPVPEYGPVAMLYIDLAMLYDSMGNQVQVEAVLNEMDSMPQGELAVGLARARIRLKHSDHKGAERILTDLSQRYPSSLVLNPLGNLEFDKKNYAQALADYQLAGGGWYLDAPAHVSIAKALQGMGRNKEAIDQCRLAEAMAPRDWAIKFECTKIRDAVASSGN